MSKRSSGTKTDRGYWRVTLTITDEFGRKTRKYFERKTLADAQSAAREWEYRNGRSTISEPESGTVKELFERVEPAIWERTGEANLRAMRLYRRKWEAKIGDLPVDQIKAPLLTRTIEAMMDKHSKSAIDKCAQCIRQAFAYAVSDLGWIESNPAESIRKPKANGKKLAYPTFTRAEYSRMLDLAEPRVKLLIRLMGDCGMRPSEAARVRPEHLFTHEDRWLVSVPRSKSEAGVRCIPVSDGLARMIEELAGKGWEGISNPVDHLQKWWREHSETRMYDLRGWRSDEWRRAGVPDQVRTALLGHTKVNFTQRVYETITAPDVLAHFPSQ